MLVGALAVLLIASGTGWWQQSWLLEQYQWRWVMGGKVLTAAQEKDYAARPGKTFKECAKGCPEMLVVRAGKFTMGSPESEKGRGSDEGPQHEVTIAKAFAVGKFTVTFTEWDACTAAGACPEASDAGWGRGNRPVIFVSWGEAKQYVAWLSRVSGKTYRLLSEAEWEYAARAGASTAYYWGDEIGRGNANCNGCGSVWDGRQTAPVGSFKPNAFGLYDMAGNVWQWVEDNLHNNNADNPPADGSVWKGGDQTQRTLRGGSWSNYPQSLRTAFRDGNSPDVRYFYIGYRVARTLNP
jgi:formylglycine-generating enzyme required for sulfatase activity